MTQKPKRPRIQAMKPEAIPGKIRECRFFLRLMSHANEEQKNEEQKNDEDFCFFYSAFICAFRTIAYRLSGVVGHRGGEGAADALWKKLRSDRNARYLIDTVAVHEIHGDGTAVSRSKRPLEGDIWAAAKIVERCTAALRTMEQIVDDPSLAAHT